jgi:hypothetical protein
VQEVISNNRRLLDFVLPLAWFLVSTAFYVGQAQISNHIEVAAIYHYSLREKPIEGRTLYQLLEPLAGTSFKD